MVSTILKIVLLAVLAAYVVKMLAAARGKRGGAGRSDRFNPGNRPVKDARFTEVDPK